MANKFKPNSGKVDQPERVINRDCLFFKDPTTNSKTSLQKFWRYKGSLTYKFFWYTRSYGYSYLFASSKGSDNGTGTAIWSYYNYPSDEQSYGMYKTITIPDYTVALDTNQDHHFRFVKPGCFVQIYPSYDHWWYVKESEYTDRDDQKISPESYFPRYDDFPGERDMATTLQGGPGWPDTAVFTTNGWKSAADSNQIHRKVLDPIYPPTAASIGKWYVYIAWVESKEELQVFYRQLNGSYKLLKYSKDDFPDQVLPEFIFVEIQGGGGGGAKGGNGGEGGGGGAGGYWAGTLRKKWATEIPTDYGTDYYSYRIDVGAFGQGGTSYIRRPAEDTTRHRDGYPTTIEVCTGSHWEGDDYTGSYQPDWEDVVSALGGEGGYVYENGSGTYGDGRGVTHYEPYFTAYATTYYQCYGGNGGSANDQLPQDGKGTKQIKLGNIMQNGKSFTPTTTSEYAVSKGYYTSRGGFSGGKSGATNLGGGGGASMFAKGADAQETKNYGGSATMGAGGAGGDDGWGDYPGGCGGGGVCVVHLPEK